jgi:hypothetical protein
MRWTKPTRRSPLSDAKHPFWVGIRSERSLVPSDEFDGELVCPECEIPYSGPYSDVFGPDDLLGVSGFCPKCGHPYWEDR